ncbi:MAG: adenylate/guanylate cyclase domain-containing protein [Acidimicrobiales bacterium]|jgi:class 3 adenylate cyclase/tetratricopeptide (TPR) repeat protein
MPNQGGRPTTPPNDAGHPLAPYFPRLTIDWIHRTPEERFRQVNGTIAFVDISGFTKLSEGLAKHGKVGAEELTATIGTCFVALLDIAVANGGRLLKFGGDALLLWFTGDAHEARACRAAVDMRAELRVAGRLSVLGQRVALRMSVGIHSGRFDFFLVGSSHRELIVTGPAVSTTVSMEATADPGEIVISDATALALPPANVGPRKGPGHLLRRTPAVPEDPFVPFEPVDPDVELARGIPVGLIDALTSSQRESEHRRVTVCFLHFDGTDALIEQAGPEVTADRLDALVSIVQTAVDRHDVVFLATDVDRDGGKIILTAGAPSTSGDDEHRMLLAVREIMDAELPLPLRTGINRGSVFVGEVGPPYRRTFTVMGDTVNLTARLMAKAEPGEILTTPEVIARAQAGFATTELEPFFVKGKSKPVRALRVGAMTGGKLVGLTEDLPFVGRSREVAELESLVGRAEEGNGALIEIVGEAGVGKSRLLGQLRELTGARTQLTAGCERYYSSTPYHVVRELLRRLLELPAEGSDDATAQLFLASLTARAPALLPWAPLIAGAVDLSVPETPQTAELDEEFRKARLADAVQELLANLLPESGLLTVEDSHFMDESSADLFRAMAASVGATSWLICMTRRDLESGFVAPDDATRIDLGPLDEQETTRLAEAATSETPLSASELGVLVRRSGGNPLFLRELLAAALGGAEVEGLPDSVEGVVAARIDRLSSDDRHLLRRLSVLGQSAPIDLVGAVVDELPAPRHPVWRRLDDFVVWDRDTLRFRNGVLRDAAYDGLTYRLRRQLHNRAGDSIRATSELRRDEQPELLSFHYLHAQRYTEAWSYALEAAQWATSVYANFEAAELYERALTAGRRLGDLGPADLSAVYEALGDARNRTGAYAEAANAYRTARRLIDHDAVATARLMLKLAQIQGWMDRYPTALRWITKGLRTLEGAEGDAATRQRAELLSWYGRFCQEAGQHARAIKWCSLAIEEAEAAGEQLALAESLRVIDWAMDELGRLEEPVNSERALAIFESLEDLTGQANMLNSLGIFAYFRGEWEESLDLYQRCQAIVRRIGNDVKVAFLEFNIGEIALDQGRLDAAEEQFQQAWRAWRAAGYRSGVADVLGKLARVAGLRGHFDEAVGLFEESVAEFRAVGSNADALEAQARLAECLVLSGRPDAALALADETLAQARGLRGVPPQVPLIQRVRGAVLAASGQPDAAAAALEQSLQAARSRGAQYEEALTLQVMAECAVDSSEEHRAELRRTSEATLSKLGVVSTPDLVAAVPGAGAPPTTLRGQFPTVATP